jgi:molybdopterin synthase sulfur carrier subunit
MKLRVFGTLREAAGGKEVQVDFTSGTVRSLLAELRAQHPGLASKVLDDRGTLESGISILVNGRSTRFLAGMDTVVGEEDRVAVFPAVGGG